MATEFICTIGASGCDFTSPITWEDTIDNVGSGDLTSARMRVYSISSIVGDMLGDLSDGTTVTGGNNSYTATVVWCTSSQIMVYHSAADQTFEASEVLTRSSGNTVTVASDDGGGDTVILVGEVDGEVEITASLMILGFTTSATNKIILRSIDATKRSVSSALRYGSAAGRILQTGASGRALYIYENYVDVEDIDIASTNAANTDNVVIIAGQDTGANQINFRRVVVRAVNGSTDGFKVNDADAVVYIDNCVVYGTRGGGSLRISGGTVNARYSVFYVVTTAGYGVQCDTGCTFNGTNCYANEGTSSGAAYYGVGTINLTTCAADDDTGTEGLDDKEAVDQFIALDSGSEDFRLQSDSALIGEGTTVSGLTTDIFGVNRPSGAEDVGAVEYSTGGIGATSAVTLPAVEVSGQVVRGVWATGAITLGAVQVSSHTGHWCTGAITLPSVTVAAQYIQAPATLYCNDGGTGAQSGDTNPTGIIDTTPNFSALIYKLTANATHVQIQVSAPGDADFSEDLSWDSGWLTLDTPVSVSGTRSEDITYGQT